MKFLESNIFKSLFKITVSIVLLVLIFRFIGVNKVYNELLNANRYYIFMAIILIIFQIFFKAVRWNAIIQIFNKSIYVIPSMHYTFISIAFGIITPGRVGEFIKAKYLSDSTKLSYFKSIITVVIDKIFDVMALVLLGLFGFSFLKDILIKPDYFIFAFVFYMLVLILIFIFFGKVLELIIYILPKKYKNNFKNFNITRTFYIKSMLISILIWFVLSIQAFFIIKALNVSISLYTIMAVVPLMSLSSAIPISIGGIGVREVVAISFFSLMGLQAEKSAVFSLLYTFITLGLSAIIGAILYVKKR